MKFSFQFLLLTYAGMYPLLVLTELAGVRLPEIVSHAQALGFFTAIMIALVMRVDYGQRRQLSEGSLRVPAGSPTLLPAHAAFTASPARAARRPAPQHHN